MIDYKTLPKEQQGRFRGIPMSIDTRQCAYCEKQLPKNSHKNRKYCSLACKIDNFRLKNLLPTTVHGEHYQFWKELHYYSATELQVLFQVRRINAKYAKSRQDLRKIKKEMKIITLVYRNLVFRC